MPPRSLSLGWLEAEIMEWVWRLGSPTARQIHEQILQDPDRELAYASVTTVLQRLVQKGWLRCDKRERSFRWQATISRQEAQALQAQEHLRKFLALGNPDVVTAFADQLDPATIEQLQGIAERLRALRQQRQEEQP
ncbi:MAG: BlaI/MecI/CopY family transcriptional regulator [Thermostichales cyanobacterium SZTDM-1c_bins_54]